MWVDAEEKKSETATDPDVISRGGSCRLVEAFEKASARARTKAWEVCNLERRAEKLNNSLVEKENDLAMEHRKVELLKKNRNLNFQTQGMKGSRNWKLLGKLGRLWARMMPRKS